MKKVLTFMLAAILLVSSVGCGKKEEKKKVTTVGHDEKVVINIFSSEASDTKGSEAWIELVEKKFNVDLQFETVPSTSYKERLQIMLASGDYPDLILFKNPGDTEFTQAIDSGILAPLDDYKDLMPDLDAWTYEYAWDAMKKDGEGPIYGIPRSTLVRTDGFLIRKDWLDNLGLPVPKNGELTLDEFYEILKAFTFDDPDGNGKNDTYGIATYSDVNKGFVLPITETFNLTGWQKAKKGEGYTYMNPQYAKKDSSYKDALKFNRKLYTEGIIDPESPVITTYVNMTDRFKRGKVGVVREFGGRFTTYRESLKETFPDINPEIVMVNKIIDKKGNVAKAPTDYNNGCYGLWGISATCEYPERIIEILNWIVSDEGWELARDGVEGVSYEVKDGVKVFNKEPGASAGISRSITRRNTDADFYLPAAGEKVSEKDRENMRKYMEEQQSVTEMSLDRGYTPAAATDPKYMDYQTKYIQAVTEIVTGKKKVSDYDKVLDDWYKNGGKEYVKEMNEYIKKLEK